MNIELETVRDAVVLRHYRRLLALFQVRTEVEARRDRQFGDHNIATQQRGVADPGQAEIGICGRTHARRITQPHIVRIRRQIHQ